MSSERQKRQEEIERIMREAGVSKGGRRRFPREVRKTAAALIEEKRAGFRKGASQTRQAINQPSNGRGMASHARSRGVHIFDADLGSDAFPLRYYCDRLGDFSETI